MGLTIQLGLKMIRRPFNEPVFIDLPELTGLSDEYLSYIDQIPVLHQDDLCYIQFKYPDALSSEYYSKSRPIDLVKYGIDFIAITNFQSLLPVHIMEVFKQYFSPSFHDIAFGKKEIMSGMRLYLNNPDSTGIHLHKDIYGDSHARSCCINIPISQNSLTSDLCIYDDELELITCSRYKKRTPAILNTSAFHEVINHDRSTIRKIITLSTPYSAIELKNLLDNGQVVR
jgi:hypothetical protein